MADPTPPRDGLAPLMDELRDLRRQLRELQKPTAGQVQQTSGTVTATLNYLAGLKRTSASSAGFDAGTVPNDGAFRWYLAPTPLTFTIPVPTGRFTCIVEASEVNLNGGQVSQGLSSFEVFDSNNVRLPGLLIGAVYGRLYTSGPVIGTRVATPQRVHTIADQVANPGPYRFSGVFGTWSAASNTTAQTVNFQDLSMTVEVIGNGVT